MTAIASVDSPLLRMVETTPTDFWNDSCAVAELEYAVERGGTGAAHRVADLGDDLLRLGRKHRLQDVYADLKLMQNPVDAH